VVNRAASGQPERGFVITISTLTPGNSGDGTFLLQAAKVISGNIQQDLVVPDAFSCLRAASLLGIRLTNMLPYYIVLAICTARFPLHTSGNFDTVQSAFKINRLARKFCGKVLVPGFLSLCMSRVRVSTIPTNSSSIENLPVPKRTILEAPHYETLRKSAFASFSASKLLINGGKKCFSHSEQVGSLSSMIPFSREKHDRPYCGLSELTSFSRLVICIGACHSCLTSERRPHSERASNFLPSFKFEPYHSLLYDHHH
jgi:hypothetical protein